MPTMIGSADFSIWTLDLKTYYMSLFFDCEKFFLLFGNDGTFAYYYDYYYSYCMDLLHI